MVGFDLPESGWRRLRGRRNSSIYGQLSTKSVLFLLFVSQSNSTASFFSLSPSASNGTLRSGHISDVLPPQSTFSPLFRPPLWSCDSKDTVFASVVSEAQYSPPRKSFRIDPSHH